MSQYQQTKVEEDRDSIESGDLSFEAIDDSRNATENESNTKIALLEERLQMVEAATKLLEEKVQLLEEKQIQQQGKKCSETELETKVKKLGNREETRRWDVSEKVTISSEGLQAKINRCKENIIARPGFPISVEHCPKDDSLWTIYYYEVTQVSQYGFAAWIGLSNGDTSSYLSVANGSNAYCVPRGCDFYINSGKSHDFEWKDGATKPEWKGPGDVVGCGVLLQSENKVSIFFTLNGQLLGREIPIKNEDGDQLFPSVTIWDMTLEANFGNDPAKPFKYDTTNCPGLELKAK